MNTDPRVRDLVIAVLGIIGVFVIIAMLARPANAEQPECTGDRHYDDCGQFCPITETTTTTIQTGECPTCPDPAPCQPVVCKDGNDGTTTIVTVDRCPEAPMYVPCNVHKKYRKGDVQIDGQWAHCARAGAPHRVFFPKTSTGY